MFHFNVSVRGVRRRRTGVKISGTAGLQFGKEYAEGDGQGDWGLTVGRVGSPGPSLGQRVTSEGPLRIILTSEVIGPRKRRGTSRVLLWGSKVEVVLGCYVKNNEESVYSFDSKCRESVDCNGIDLWVSISGMRLTVRGLDTGSDEVGRTRSVTGTPVSFGTFKYEWRD